MWLSMIVMLVVAFVNGARNGECCSQNEIANLNGNTKTAVTVTIVITRFPSLRWIFCTNWIWGFSTASFIKVWTFTIKILFNVPHVLIVRGWHTAVRKGPNVQLSGASGVTCNSRLCRQRQLPSGHWTGCSYRVAPRRSLSPQQPGDQWKRQGFRGCYTELQPHQGVPHLLRPGLSCSSGWRSGDQSWMWEKFQPLVHVCSLIIKLTCL